MGRVLGVFAVVGCTLVTLYGCGGDDDDTTGNAGHGATGGAGHGPGGGSSGRSGSSSGGSMTAGKGSGGGSNGGSSNGGSSNGGSSNGGSSNGGSSNGGTAAGDMGGAGAGGGSVATAGAGNGGEAGEAGASAKGGTGTQAGAGGGAGEGTGGTTQATNGQKLTVEGLASGDTFGGAIAVVDDRVLVGTMLKTVDGRPQQGAAEVFVRSGATWVPETSLVASDGSSGDWFGGAVALSDQSAFVGASHHANGGVVYYFTREGSVWTEAQKLVPTSGASGELFGSTLALDGSTVAIGSDGLARVFTDDGGVWSEQQTIPLPAEAFENGFGRCALAGDTLVIGSLRDTVGSNSEQGSAYVYERSGTTWTRTQRLVADDGQENDHFGNTVAISGDTIVVAVDSYFHPELSGAAYVFVRDGGSFVQQAKLLPPDGAPQDAFGLMVAVRGDLALVAASQHEHAGIGSNTGSAYLFSRSQSQWTPVQELMATDPTDNAKFGAPVAMSRTHVAVGAPYFSAGAAYVFDL